MIKSNLDNDLYHCLNKMFDNCFPKVVQYLNIEMQLDAPTIITVKYIPESVSKEPIETKFGLIEHPKEFQFTERK